MPVSIPVEGGNEEGAVEEEFLSGWFMAPDNYEEDDSDTNETEALKGPEEAPVPSGATVILYLHGNAETISQGCNSRDILNLF